MTGDYPGVVDRWHVRFDQATGLVALPYHLDQMMQATTDHCPQTIVSPWFEFVGWGPGYNDDYYPNGGLRYNWTNVITDRGEAPTQVPVPVPEYLEGPWVLRVYATVDEDVASVAPEINIQGLDTDGLAIRTLVAGEYINGVNVAIDFGVPYTATTQEFSKITAVIKPATRSYVRLTAWNGVVEIDLSNYAYNETTPSYRHYYVPMIHNRGRAGVRERILLARCRKRFVPVAAETDVLIISNSLALGEMMVAQWKRTAGNIPEYLVHRKSAIDLLQQEAMGYTGKRRIPAMTFGPGFGLGQVPFIR